MGDPSDREYNHQFGGADGIRVRECVYRIVPAAYLGERLGEGPLYTQPYEHGGGI